MYYENLLSNKSDIYSRLRNYAGVYILINNKNHKFYVGSSINLTERMTHYLHIFKKGESKRTIDRTILKYGLDNFSLGLPLLLEKDSFSDPQELKQIILATEQSFIKKYKPHYNTIKNLP